MEKSENLTKSRVLNKRSTSPKKFKVYKMEVAVISIALYLAYIGVKGFFN